VSHCVVLVPHHEEVTDMRLYTGSVTSGTAVLIKIQVS